MDTTTRFGRVLGKRRFGGAVGAGTVLVCLPTFAMYFGISKFDSAPAVGLPMLAIFGIMILLGALVLTSTLFARLGLDDRTQALALPEGSIRAVIALSLIVLFAIISIMLFQAISKPLEIAGLTEAEKLEFVKERPNDVVAVIPSCDAGVGVSRVCSYTVFVQLPPGRESTDLAKQLLILIGTLMTSVTSFYFASRTGDSGVLGRGRLPAVAESTIETNEVDEHDHYVDPAAATHDEDLPQSIGGVGK